MVMRAVLEIFLSALLGFVVVVAVMGSKVRSAAALAVLKLTAVVVAVVVFTLAKLGAPPLP